MKQSPFQGLDPLHFTLGLLLLLALFGQPLISAFFATKSTPFFVYEVLRTCIMGLYFLYGGIKKLRQGREQHESAHWFTQPSILTGIGTFLLLPYIFLEIIVGTATMNMFPLFIQIVLFLPISVCYLAAILLQKAVIFPSSVVLLYTCLQN